MIETPFRPFNALANTAMFINALGCNPVNQFGVTWLTNFFLFGKIGENPVITPTTSVQVVRASAPNRYLESVTVEGTTAPTP